MKMHYWAKETSERKGIVAEDNISKNKPEQKLTKSQCFAFSNFFYVISHLLLFQIHSIPNDDYHGARLTCEVSICE